MKVERKEERERYSLSLNEPGSLDDLPRRLDVALLAKVHHGGPAGRDDSAGPGAVDGRRAVDAAGPVRGDGVLVVQVLLLAIEYHGAALGRVAVLVRVGADAADARQSEVEVRQTEAGLPHEADEEAAEAGVHVDGHPLLEPDLRDALHVVYRAVREVRRRAHQLQPNTLPLHQLPTNPIS